MKKTYSFVLSVGLILVVGIGATYGLGFRNPSQGSAATGQAEAFVATADDPTAIWYNPAGIVQLKGTQFYFGSYLVLPKAKVELTPSAGGGAWQAKEKWALLPQLYAVTDWGLDQWRFALGINSPFGLSTDWGNGTPFRTVITEAELRLLNINPCVAFQVTPGLSVAFGLDYYLSDTELVQGVVPIAFGGGADKFTFKGDGDGFGYNIGILWRLNEQHSFGAAYRSKVKVKYNGDATLINAPVPGAFLRDNAEADMVFPPIITVGYAFRPTPRLKFELNVDWTGWEQLNTLDLKSTFFPNSLPLHWESSFFYELGAEYKLNDNWTARAGYCYSENTVPDATFHPMVPDSDRHIFGVGLSYVNGPWNFGCAYQYTLGEKRTVTGTAFSNAPFPPASVDGRYSTSAHAIALSISRRF